MNEATFHELTRQVELEQAWIPDSIMLGLESGEKLDLLPSIGPTSTEELQLPLEFSGTDFKDQDSLRESVTTACQNAGFDVFFKQDAAKKNLLEVKCSRSTKYRQWKEKGSRGKPRKSYSKRPIQQQDVCRFCMRFRFLTVDGEQRWCSVARTGDNRHHGHIKLDPVHIIGNSSKNMSDEDRDTAMRMFEINCPITAVQAMIKHRSGLLVKKRAFEMIQSAASKATFEGNTQAEQLISFFKDEDGVSFIALYDHPQSDQVTFNRPRGMGRTNRFKRLHRHADGTETYTDIHVEEAMKEKFDEFRRLCDMKRKALTVDNGTKILLAVLWTTDQNRRLHRLFLEVTCADVVEQLNNLKRSLIAVQGKTSTGRTFTALEGFLPSLSQYVFYFCFGVAAPALLDKEALAQNKLNITDDDVKEHGAFASLIPTVYPKSKGRLCSFHAIYRSDLSKIRVDPNSEEQMKILQIATQWMKTWTQVLETTKEVEDSKLKFEQYNGSSVVSNVVGTAVASDLILFAKKKLYSKAHMLFRCNFMNVRSFDTHASSWAEGEFGATKRSPIGPKPNHTLPKSSQAIVGRRKRQGSAVLQEAAMSMQKSAVAAGVPLRLDLGLDDTNEEVAADDESVHFEATLTECATPPTIDEITTYAYDLFEKEYNGQTYFSVFRKSQDTFYVKATKYKKQLSSSWRYFVPQYEHTRVVRIIKLADGTEVIVCSCNHFCRHGRPCSHIWRVIIRKPRASDFSPRWLKTYIQYCFADGHEKMTRTFMKTVADDLKGPQVDLSRDVIRIPPDTCIGCQEDPAWFEKSLPDKSPVVREGNYWSRTLDGEELETLVAGSHTMETEIKLSQAQTTNRNVGDAQDDSCPGIHNYDTDDGYEEEVATKSPSKKKTKMSRTAYSSFEPMFSDCCKIADSSERTFEIMERTMEQLYGELCDEVKPKNEEEWKELEGLPGLPIDKRKHAKRLSRFSPARKGKK